MLFPHSRQRTGFGKGIQGHKESWSERIKKIRLHFTNSRLVLCLSLMKCAVWGLLVMSQKINLTNLDSDLVSVLWTTPLLSPSSVRGCGGPTELTASPYGFLPPPQAHRGQKPAADGTARLRQLLLRTRKKPHATHTDEAGTGSKANSPSFPLPGRCAPPWAAASATFGWAAFPWQ